MIILALLIAAITYIEVLLVFRANLVRPDRRWIQLTGHVVIGLSIVVSLLTNPPFSYVFAVLGMGFGILTILLTENKDLESL